MATGLPDTHLPYTWDGNAKVLGMTIPNPLNPVPRIWTNLNRIKSITEVQCNDSWNILVETLPLALGKALLLWIIPDPKQILQNYLRPAGRRGVQKGLLASKTSRIFDRGGSSRRGMKGGIPDIDHEIAQFIPGRSILGQRVAGTAEKWLWAGIDMLDLVGFVWLLTETLDTFTYSWMSGMIETRFKGDDCDSRLSGTWSIPGETNGLQAWGQPANLKVAPGATWAVNPSQRLSTLTPPKTGIVTMSQAITIFTFSATGKGTATYQIVDTSHSPARIITSQTQSYSRDKPNMTFQLQGDINGLAAIQVTAQLNGDSGITSNSHGEIAIFGSNE